jgi:hypothetical protein
MALLDKYQDGSFALYNRTTTGHTIYLAATNQEASTYTPERKKEHFNRVAYYMNHYQPTNEGKE